MLDGFSNEELIAIGARKIKFDLPISATDINSNMSFAASQIAIKQTQGVDEIMLKQAGARQIDAPAFTSSQHINALPLDAGAGDRIQKALTPLENFLTARGMRIR